MVRRPDPDIHDEDDEEPDATMPEPYLVTVQDPTFNLLIAGDPGAGKTTLACTAQDHPEMKNVLLGDIEGGTLSIAHRGDINAISLKATNEVEALAWDLANGRYKSVKTFILDNATELQTRNLEEIVSQAIKNGRNKVRGTVMRTIDDVWQEDYGRSTVQLKRLIRFCRDLPMNFIMTTHLKRVYPKVPDGTDLKTVQPIALLPSLTGKLAESVMGYMDFVWTLEYDADEESDTHGQRFLITANRGEYRCKTRGPRFFEAVGEVILNPTLPEIYDTFVRTAHAPPTSPKQKKKARSR